jgi:hypothetical protein
MSVQKLTTILAIGSGVLLSPWVVGCKSVSQYVAPRIEGRVVDASSHQPIEGVVVKRLNGDEASATMEPPKGGALMMRDNGVRTSADGAFVLESMKDLAVFRKLTWYSVSVSFEQPAYQRFIGVYTLNMATNHTTGEPIIHAGDVLLTPVSTQR